jgi:hypothetical protein
MAVLPPSEIETIRGLPETDVSIKYVVLLHGSIIVRAVRWLMNNAMSKNNKTDAITTMSFSESIHIWAPRQTNSTTPCATCSRATQRLC